MKASLQVRNAVRKRPDINYEAGLQVRNVIRKRPVIRRLAFR